MASSSSNGSYSALLDNLQLVMEFCRDSKKYDLRKLIDGLRFLKTFLLYAKNWGNNYVNIASDHNVAIHHASLGALVVRIEDAISKWGPKINSIYLAAVNNPYTDGPFKPAFALGKDIRSLNREIYDWYAIFSDFSSKQSSNSPVKKDDLMEFLDSLLENLVDFSDYLRENFLFIFSRRKYGGQDVVKLIEGLEEKLKFLKNFMCFVTLCGIEEKLLGPLMSHIQAVTVNAACLSFKYRFIYQDELCKEIQKGVSVLLQKIIPVEPQVHATCIQALIASKSPEQSYGDTCEDVARDFISSLLFNLWKIYWSDTRGMTSLKDQLQMICDGLRSVRSILMEKPKKFDNEMRDLTRIVVCDAGLLVLHLSLHPMKDGLVEEMDLASFGLVENIKHIEAAVAEKCPEMLSSNFPRTNELGFIDFLLESMVDLTSSETSSNALVNYPVQRIQEELLFLRPLLEKIVELCTGVEEIEALWDRVAEVAYKIEFLIDSLLVGDIPHSSSTSLDSILEQIEIIKGEAMKIIDTKRPDVKGEGVIQRVNDMPSRINDVVVGLEDEAKSIIKRLKGPSRPVQIIHIVGMAGLGKTTLAKKVYNDPSVTSHFHERAWCTISQFFHTKKVLLEILACIVSPLPNDFFEMCEERLHLELYRKLKKNKYLIVLDDVWDSEVWNVLKATFPDDGEGSRVIITSRIHGVAPQDKLDKEPHSLRELTREKSWDLFTKRLCPETGLPPPKLCELRMQIVEKCRGLPLTIVILAGILSNIGQDCWEGVVESLSAHTVSTTEQCTATLELSYKHLPDRLKPCFLYLGAFPEDQEYTPRRLIQLWVAEGFVRKTQIKSSEDVANDYMMDLIGRNLIMVFKTSSIGGVKACRVHDLLHEFCITKAKEDNFSQLVRGYNELYTLHIPHYLRRLCIYSEPEHIRELRFFPCSIRSLLFFAHGKTNQEKLHDHTSIFYACKLVRVLDLSQIHIGLTFPTEIELLVLLRYLAVMVDIDSIPSSIANLRNLETFIVRSETSISLPDTIWNLQKLRHLHICGGLGFYWPIRNLDNSPNLCNLVSFSRAILPAPEDLDKLFKKFPNIRKMKCIIPCSDDDSSPWHKSTTVLGLDFLNQLESLNLGMDEIPMVQHRYPIEFQFSPSLRKLNLSRFRLTRSHMQAIANLPNLEALKLIYVVFEDKIWSVDEEEFPSLRFLKLCNVVITRWTTEACEDCFPRLEKLVLYNCIHLTEIPLSLGEIQNLKMIEVSECDPSVATSAKGIQEEQRRMGNDNFKILIPRFPGDAS